MDSLVKVCLITCYSDISDEKSEMPWKELAIRIQDFQAEKNYKCYQNRNYMKCFKPPRRKGVSWFNRQFQKKTKVIQKSVNLCCLTPLIPALRKQRCLGFRVKALVEKKKGRKKNIKDNIKCVNYCKKNLISISIQTNVKLLKIFELEINNDHNNAPVYCACLYSTETSRHSVHFQFFCFG